MAEIDVSLRFSDDGIDEKLTNVAKSVTKLDTAFNESSKTIKGFNRDLVQEVRDPYAKLSANLQVLRDKVQLVQSVFSEFSDEIESVKFDKLTEGIGKFGLSTEQVISIGGDFISFLTGTLTPMGLLTSVASVLATTFKDDLVPIINTIVGKVNELIDPVGSANEAFNKQLALVTEIDNEVPSLVKTYEELSKKQNKSEAEQTKLNEATARIAELLPQAVEGVDAYTGALIINVDKVRALSVEQREFAKVLAQSSIELNKEELKRIEIQQKIQNEILKTGKIQKSVLVPSTTGFGGRLESQEFKLTKEQQAERIALAQQLSEKQQELSKQIKIQQAIIDGTSNTELEARKKEITANDEKGKSIEKVTKKVKESSNETDKLIDKLEALQKKLANQSEDATIKSLENNEAIVLAQKDKALRLINEQEKEINELAKSLNKKIDVEQEFNAIRLQLENEFQVKLKAARDKDFLTQTGVDRTKQVKEINDELKKINFDGIGGNKANNALLLAIANPNEFKKQFNELNKIGKDGAQKLGDEIKKTLGGSNFNVDAITDPILRIKLKLQNALGIDDKQLGVIQNQLANVTNSFANFYFEQNELAAQAQDDIVKSLDKRIDYQSKALEKELQNQKDGSANSVETAKAELALLEQQRSEALTKANAEREKNRKAQLISDGISQVSNLITAGSEIIKGFSKIPVVGVLLGIAAVGAMLAGFASLKAKSQASVPKLRLGRDPEKGYQAKGDTHESPSGGIHALIENDEFVMGTKQSKQHAPFLRRMLNNEFDGVNLDSMMHNSRLASSVNRTSNNLIAAKHSQERFMLSQAIEKQTERLIKAQGEQWQITSLNDKLVKVKTTKRGTRIETIKI